MSDKEIITTVRYVDIVDENRETKHGEPVVKVDCPRPRFFPTDLREIADAVESHNFEDWPDCLPDGFEPYELVCNCLSASYYRDCHNDVWVVRNGDAWLLPDGVTHNG